MEIKKDPKSSKKYYEKRPNLESKGMCVNFQKKSKKG